MNFKKLITSSIIGAAVLGISAIPAFAAPAVVYDALPSVTPLTNYASLGFQATQTQEFGDYIHLGDTARILKTVTVTMSDWALYSNYSTDVRYMNDSTNWTHPITLNVYNVIPGTPNKVGSLLGTVTQTITIPWRPAEDSTCPLSGGIHGWKTSNNTCVNGLAFNATFDLSSLNVTLPNDIIVGVAFNTNTWGYNPIGTGGPYESLNVAVPANQVVSVGTDDNSDNVFWNTKTPGNYTDGGLGGVGIFREDTKWTPNGTVALQVTANLPTPTNKDQCNDGGWKNLADGNGNPFKNQGDCVSYVQSNPNAIGNKSK